MQLLPAKEPFPEASQPTSSQSPLASAGIHTLHEIDPLQGELNQDWFKPVGF